MESADLMNLLPGILTQARSALAGLRLAETRLVPPEVREADPVKDRQAAVLDQNYYRLLRLVNDLTLTLSLAQGQPPLMRDCDLAELVGGLFQQALGLCDRLDVDLRWVCRETPLVCSVDREGLEAIFLHLLSNALRSSPPGGVVTVDLRRSGRQVLLSVQDAGPGISQEQREALFLSPRRDGALPDLSALPGAGMGLLLCNHLARRQGGALVVESPLEKGGTRFTLSLPLQTTGSLSDPHWDFSGGVNKVLLALSDILPAEAFLTRYQEDF